MENEKIIQFSLEVQSESSSGLQNLENLEGWNQRQKQTVLEDFHMILGRYLYKNTFPIIFFPKLEEEKIFYAWQKNILCMAEKYLV